MGSGAWSSLVRGVICLVNSDNERDLSLLVANVLPFDGKIYISYSELLLALRRTRILKSRKCEAITGL